MSVDVIWSPEAKLTMSENIDYLVAEWNAKTVAKFVRQVESALLKIKRNPLSYLLQTSTSNVRWCKINKRITLYYRVVNDKSIQLVTFWNINRTPEDLKL